MPVRMMWRWRTCGLLIPSTTRLQVTREIFEAAGGRLKVVGRAGVGVDNVDLTAATEVQTPSWHQPRHLAADLPAARRSRASMRACLSGETSKTCQPINVHHGCSTGAWW